MAVRIEQYEERIATPGGQVAGAEGRAGGSVRLDLASIGDAVDGILAAREQAETNNARADLASRDPAAQLAFATELTRLQREWAPGQPAIAEQMGGFIDRYTAEQEKTAPNDVTRKLLRARSDELRTHYMLRGVEFQTGAEAEHRRGLYAKSYADVAALAVQEPERLGELLAPVNATVMADSQLPTAERQELVRAKAAAAAEAVAKTMAERDPGKVVGYTGVLLGLANPTLKPNAPGGDVVEAIIARESGGRMYGADGKVLRGPAIQTKDGRTIHAFGKYQLLEETAQATAAAAGVPWNPELFHRARTGDPRLDAETAQYHDLLGQAYIARQNEEFGGDPLLIAAAHNMGPAATKGWAEGRPYQTQSGKWWYPKGPKDLDAMPAETRKYIEGLGTVDASPSVPGVDPQSDEAQAFRLLTPEQLLAVRSAAESTLAAQRREREAQLAVERTLFRQRVQDLETAAKHGDPITLPADAELVTFLGPGEAALTKTRLLGYQKMAGALQGLPARTNAELAALVTMPDPDGTTDRENQQFIRDTIAAQAKATLAAREADPGAAALRSSPEVQRAFMAWREASAAAQQAGAQADPAAVAAVEQSSREFIASAFAVQRQWGILEPKLPAAIVDDLADGFRYAVQRDPAQAARRFAALPAQLGSYEAIQQVGNKTGALGWFAMEGVPPRVLRTLQQAQSLKPEEAAKLLPEGFKAAEVKAAVSAAFAPLLSTFTAPGPDGSGDNAAATRYYGAGVTLAQQYLASGQAPSPKAAAEMAYRDLYADRETVLEGLRIPNELGPAQVVEGLRRRKGNLPAASMFVGTPSPGLTLEETRERIARAVQQSGRWVTNEAGTGAYLMLAGKPVLDAGGKPIAAAFREVLDEQRPLGERQREAARLDSLARGLK